MANGRAAIPVAATAVAVQSGDMQTAQDFRRGAITLANLKGPLRSAQRHVERQASELKAIGPVARRLQHGFLDVLDRVTTRSNYQLELQVIEAMRRAVLVEEAEARGEGIGWPVPEHVANQFWVEVSNSFELHEGAVIYAELQNPAGGVAVSGFAPGGCIPSFPWPSPLQVDLAAARRFIPMTRRKYKIANDILHTAVDTLAPLGLDLQSCSTIAEAMRTYEKLASYVKRVSTRAVSLDRYPSKPPDLDRPNELPPRSDTPHDPGRYFRRDGLSQVATMLNERGTFHRSVGVFTQPPRRDPAAGEGRLLRPDAAAPMTWTGESPPSRVALPAEPFRERTPIDPTVWSSPSLSGRTTPSTA